MPRRGHREQRWESAQNHRIAQDADPRRDGEETVQLEHSDPTRAAVAEQEQDTAEKALRRVMASLQEYCPARRSQMAMCTSRRPLGHPEWPNAPEDGPAF